MEISSIYSSEGVRDVKFNCKYQRTLYRDEYSGFTIFSVIPEDSSIARNKYGNISIKGKICPCVKDMPLLIDCEAEENGDGFTYILTSYELKTSSLELLQSFLISFRGIGPKAAEKLSAVDVFSIPKMEEPVEFVSSCGVTKANAVQFVEKIKEIVNLKEVFEKIVKYGGTYSSALTLYRIYKDNTLKVLENNPFIMLKAGIPFRICENIAREEGIAGYDVRRLAALLQCAYYSNSSQGHTKAEFSKLCSIASALEEDAGGFYHTEPFYLAGVIDAAGLVMCLDDGVPFIYSKESYTLEKNTAMNIHRISATRRMIKVDDKLIEKIEENIGIKYSLMQRAAFSLIESPGIKVLTGGPGTGKTTVINGIIRAYSELYPYNKILLCAPTGCAAKRLEQATGKKASTIHKLLEVQPTSNGYVQRKNENSRLDAGLIIVDEGSMLDARLFQMLLCAVKSGAVVLLSGDEDQLEPVGQGNILHDLIKVPFISCCRLNRVYRQKGNSLILENSIRMRAGDYNLSDGPDYEIIRCNTKEQMLDALNKKIKEEYDINNPNDTKVYMPVKSAKYQISTRNVNKQMHDLFNADNSKDYLAYQDKRFSKGDPVIFVTNNYEKGYFNGDTGIITAVLSGEQSKSLIIEMDNREIEVSGACLKDVELAYAITAHKSQGSECENAIILLPETPSIMLTRSLVYVATTRAKKKNTLIVQNDALKTAIENRHKCTRNTGLCYRIKEEFGK